MLTYPKSTAPGFTLIELLVAMAIFVFLAAAMYGGTQYIMLQREIMLVRQGELESLQRTVRYLQTDLTQIFPRDVRDELGRDRLPALFTDPGNDIAMRLSRDGWRNPAEFKRGTLQRVQYRYNEDERILYRDYWPVMDRVLGMEAREQEILTGVEEFDIEFLDEKGEWQQDWPPANSKATLLPSAVRFRFLLDSFGEVIRLVEMAG
ncbi:MAG: type II secretion system minor pseudopilin GspJ [Gammaproteobacteria bacterium]|nr:type II secretion system minor pseudopilin GspJ [Gammaproteobacteria bacterium]MDP7270130.1 type II secretion system minor pseudopilin GspJ [Gammaproteobacteria bacterium]HJP03802.1 type II secretion system minor pseudopilin GspJ [Gammaproteobacteria bacterium]